MLRVLIYFAVVVLASLGVVWMADHPGTVLVTFGGREYQSSTLVALIALLVAAGIVALAWSVIRFVFRIPTLMSVASRSRRRQRGFAALSRGMVAVGTGDETAALRYSAEATRLLAREPMTLLLRAQSAQMSGDQPVAEKTFAEMLKHPETRALGLRGLHIEAQRRGDPEAAYAYAEEALKVATLSWAGQAVLEHRAQRGDWAGALAAVERNTGGRLVDRGTARRQRAILGTALAGEIAERDPDQALSLVRDALKEEPTLVPAAALAGKLFTRRGDIRRASKLLETAYVASPHPDLADAYVGVRPGDAAADRLARAETLARIVPHHPESRMAVAHAALEAREFDQAREALKPLVEAADGSRPTARVCRLMAEIEEAENGETGALFEWLQRARSRAARPDLGRGRRRVRPLGARVARHGTARRLRVDHAQGTPGPARRRGRAAHPDARARGHRTAGGSDAPRRPRAGRPRGTPRGCHDALRRAAPARTPVGKKPRQRSVAPRVRVASHRSGAVMRHDVDASKAMTRAWSAATSSAWSSRPRRAAEGSQSRAAAAA